MVDINQQVNQAAAGGGMGQRSAREVEVMLSANTGPFQDEMKKAGSAAGSVADALQKVEQAYVSAIRSTGKAGMGIGAAMQASAAAAVWSAAQFEESFARVAKTTGLENQFGQMAASLGIGETALQDFADEIRILSTEMPVHVEELAHLADVAGTLGVESEHLGKFAETAATLGAAINELGSAQAIAGLANLMGAFGDAPESVDHLASSLADLSNKTRGSADQMLMFGDRLAGTAVQVGMTSEEVLALGAAVSAIGAQPELGATAIIQFLTRVSRAVQTGGQDLERFADAMDMTGDQLREMWELEGGTPVLHRFLQALSDQGEGATVTLQKVGLSGVSTTQVLGGLAAQIDVVNDSLRISSDAYEEGSAAAELAAIRFDTVVSNLRQMRQAIAEVWRAMGQGFLRPMNEAIQLMTKFINLFHNIPRPIKTVMGMVMGLGGALLTLGGGVLLLVAKFHFFLAILTHMPAIIAGVVGAIKSYIIILTALGTASSSAAASMGVLGTALTGLMNTLGLIVRSGRLVVGFLVTQLATAIRAVGTAAMWASRRLLAFTFAETGRMAATLATTMGRLATAITGVGTAAAGSAVKASPLMLLLGKAALVIGGLQLAISALNASQRRWGTTSTETTGTMSELAEAVLGSYTRVSDFAAALDGATDSEQSFAEQAARAVRELRELREEGEQASSQDYLLRYGMLLMAQGVAPDVVQNQVEELARLADVPIRFQYTFEEMAGGEGFARQLEAAAGGFDDFIGLMEGKMRTQFSLKKWAWDFPTDVMGAFETGAGTEVSEEFKKGFDDYLSAVLKTVSENQAARLVAINDIQEDLNEALREDDMAQNVFEWAQSQLEERGMVQTEGMEPTGAEKVFGERLQRGGFRAQVAQLLEDPAQQQTEQFESIREVVRDVTGEVNGLGEAVRNATQEEVEAMARGFMNVAEQVHLAKFEVDDIVGDISDLEAAFSGAGTDPDISDNEEAMGRYRNHLAEAYPLAVGHAQAIEEAEHFLANLVDQGQEWSEEAEWVRKVLKSWGEEMAQMNIRDLEQELNGMGAAQQVEYLLSLMSALDTSLSSSQQMFDVYSQRAQQALNQQEQEFRQLMGQRQSLLDQQASAQESHNQRMSRMAEDHGRRLRDMRRDHDKSVERMNKNYQERLRDIAKQEKEQLEERVEAMSRAFNIMERLQSQRAASAQRILHNMEQQNRVMAEMRRQMETLQGMGLNVDMMEQMGFDDPRNFSQARRLYEDILADPSLIEDLNRQWAQRLKVGEAFTESVEKADIGETISEKMEEARKEAEEAHNEQMEDLNERYREQLEQTNESHARNVARAEEDHARQMNQIAKNLAKLGQDNVKTIQELIEEGVESGIDGIMSTADALDKAMIRMAEIMRTRGNDVAEEARTAFRNAMGEWDQYLRDVQRVSAHGVGSVTGRPPTNPFTEIHAKASEIQQTADQGARTQSVTGGYLIRNAGGPVPGMGNEDKVPAILTPGEFVVNKDAVAAYGMEMMEAINAERFHNGGRVGMPTSRGRESGASGPDITKALAMALAQGSGDTYGPITVVSNDPRDMEKKLDRRKRQRRLTQPDRGRMR